MGNDGGSIPKRRELVKEAARLPTTSELKATAQESFAHAWTTCPISSAPLDPQNTVADSRGRLYNYETVLQCLMPSSSSDDTAGGDSETQSAAEFARSGIRSLKDVVKLKFTQRPSDGVRICPLALKELGPGSRAVYIVPCGHVFTEIVMRELLACDEKRDPKSACMQCGEEFAMRDMVPILPETEADVEKCLARMEELRSLGLTHNLKKEKSAGKKKRKAAAEEGDGGTNGGDKKAVQEKKQKRARDDISSRINNSMTATLTAKVLAEQDERNRQRKLAAAAR